MWGGRCAVFVLCHFTEPVSHTTLWYGSQWREKFLTTWCWRFTCQELWVCPLFFHHVLAELKLWWITRHVSHAIYKWCFSPYHTGPVGSVLCVYHAVIQVGNGSPHTVVIPAAVSGGGGGPSAAPVTAQSLLPGPGPALPAECWWLWSSVQRGHQHSHSHPPSHWHHPSLVLITHHWYYSLQPCCHYIIIIFTDYMQHPLPYCLPSNLSSL